MPNYYPKWDTTSSGLISARQCSRRPMPVRLNRVWRPQNWHLPAAMRVHSVPTGPSTPWWRCFTYSRIRPVTTTFAAPWPLLRRIYPPRDSLFLTFGMDRQFYGCAPLYASDVLAATDLR